MPGSIEARGVFDDVEALLRALRAALRAVVVRSSGAAGSPENLRQQGLEIGRRR